MSENGQIDIWYTVGEEGVALLDHQTMHPTAKYPYDTIVTFGGCLRLCPYLIHRVILNTTHVLITVPTGFGF